MSESNSSRVTSSKVETCATSGVGDQDVEPAELAGRRGDHRVDLARIGDVDVDDGRAAAERADLLGDDLALLAHRGKVRERDVESVIGQPQGDAPANPPGTARHERDAS